VAWNLGGTNVKISKTISSRVIEANKTNARKSTGPRSAEGKIIVSRNAVKHSLLAKRLTFRDPEEQAEFAALLERVRKGVRTHDVLEGIVAEELSLCCWKLQAANGWELEELRDGRKAANARLIAVAKTFRDDQLPLFATPTDPQAAASLGWHCQELVIRTESASSEQEEEADFRDRERIGKSKQLQVVAQLGSSLDTVLRYETSIKRDLYRAIGTLREMRRECLAKSSSVGAAR
jgi:hypothetical protein